MICVIENGRGDTPGIRPRYDVFVDENAHQFRDGEGRMRVIQLYDGMVRQRRHFAVLDHMALYNVL